MGADDQHLIPRKPKRDAPPGSARREVLDDLNEVLRGAWSVHERACLAVTAVARQLQAAGDWLAEVDRARWRLTAPAASGRNRLVLDWLDRLHEMAVRSTVVKLTDSAGAAPLAQAHHAPRLQDAAGDRVRMVGELAAALVAAVSVQDVSAVLAKHVQQAVDCDVFYLRRMSAEEGLARAIHVGGGSMDHQDGFTGPSGEAVPLDLPGALAEVTQTMRPVFIESRIDYQHRYGYYGATDYGNSRVEGLAGLPVLVDGQLLVILTLGYWSPQEFPAEQRLFLTTVADLAGQALGRALCNERLRQLQSLSDLALAYASLSELARGISACLSAALAATQVQLYLHDARRCTLTPVGDNAATIPGGGGLLAAAVAARRAVVVPDVTTAGLAEADPFRRFANVAALPLAIGAAVVGVVLVGRADRAPFTAADLDLMDLLAGRIALAVDRARSFDHQRHLTRTLQAALLPTMLPVIPGMTAAARYAAAGSGIDAGGDFYDVFALDDEHWLAVIGDVRGRGPAAAVTTGLIRHTIRAIAVEEHDPARILTRLNSVVYAATGPEDFATVACVRICPRAQHAHLTIASAGHCHPLILRAKGDLEVVEVPGNLIGAFTEFDSGQQTCTLGPADVLVLYTDGVVEASGRHGRYGEERLAEALGTMTGKRVEDIVRAVHDDVLAHCNGVCDDDLAMLAFSVIPTPARE